MHDQNCPWCGRRESAERNFQAAVVPLLALCSFLGAMLGALAAVLLAFQMLLPHDPDRDNCGPQGPHPCWHDPTPIRGG